jgi:hypothetical protein
MVATHPIFWCFEPCKSSPCKHKKKGIWCYNCKVRAWSTKKELEGETRICKRRTIDMYANALEEGTRYFRVSDNKLLGTPEEIVEAFSNEGSVRVEGKTS